MKHKIDKFVIDESELFAKGSVKRPRKKKSYKQDLKYLDYEPMPKIEDYKDWDLGKEHFVKKEE